MQKRREKANYHCLGLCGAWQRVEKGLGVLPVYSARGTWALSRLWAGGEVKTVLRQWAAMQIHKSQPGGILYLHHFLPWVIKVEQAGLCGTSSSSAVLLGRIQRDGLPRKTELQGCFFSSPVQMPGAIYLLKQWPWELSQ